MFIKSENHELSKTIVSSSFIKPTRAQITQFADNDNAHRHIPSKLFQANGGCRKRYFG